MSRQTRFARAFEPWIAAWSRMKLSGTQERVLLLLIEEMERDANGNFTAWRPRREIADILGLSEETVRQAIKGLKQKGAIQQVGTSRINRCQRYKIMAAKVGGLETPPIIEKRGVYGHQRGGSSTTIEGGTPDPPTRSVEGATAAPSKVLPSAKELYPGNKVV